MKPITIHTIQRPSEWSASTTFCRHEIPGDDPTALVLEVLNDSYCETGLKSEYVLVGPRIWLQLGACIRDMKDQLRSTAASRIHATPETLCIQMHYGPVKVLCVAMEELDNRPRAVLDSKHESTSWAYWQDK